MFAFLKIETLIWKKYSFEIVKGSFAIGMERQTSKIKE